MKQIASARECVPSLILLFCWDIRQVFSRISGWQFLSICSYPPYVFAELAAEYAGILNLLISTGVYLWVF